MNENTDIKKSQEVDNYGYCIFYYAYILHSCQPFGFLNTSKFLQKKALFNFRNSTIA